ncbi:MAG: DNA polymerase III subunit beta [Sulfurospirillum sp.]|nr:DNA polymerase III subunit beta [Sulfurospirillum sp.]
MKVAIRKSILENMLINTQSYLEKKDLSQITAHLFMSAENDNFILKASDYEMGLQYTTHEVKIVNEGMATANGKKFLDVIKGLREDDIILETINDYLYIKQNSSKFKLPMFNPTEFPKFPTIDEKSKLQINSTYLVKSLKKIANTIDTNNPKYELNGALIDIKEKNINLVATDTRRLAIVKMENEIEDTFSIIIPKKAINEIQKLFFDTIEMFYDQFTLIAKSKNFIFYTKLINGKFPDYERIIPKNINFRLLLSRDKMLASLKQIAIISNEIKITFKTNNIVFESLNSDNTEAKTEIEFKTGLDEEIVLALNARYILDFLSNVDEENFTLAYNDSGLPFILENNEFITIVMPITL